MADRLTISCAACGSDQFNELPADPKPHDVVTCAGCGASARYDEVQSAALKQATKAVEDAVRNAFKGLKGWTQK